MIKLPPKNLVRQYELTFVIPGDRTSVQVAAVDTAVKTLAKKHKIKVVSEEDWGKKELAYTIVHNTKRHDEGYYHHFVLETEASNVRDFEQDISLNQDVMRHLLVIAEETPAVAAPESAEE